MIPIRRSEPLPIHSEVDVVKVRHAVRAWAIELKFSLVDQTKLVTAASELARNALVYGLGGKMEMEEVSLESLRGLRLKFIDQGPGILDISTALQDGYTSGGGMGMGLPGAKRLSNEFHIESGPGKGTQVTIVKWKGR